MIEIRKCNRCDHEWALRGLKTEPVRCPKCKSQYWNKERKRPKKEVL
jgi:predicted Zn-ribbon and HTH transcriptional regulator